MHALLRALRGLRACGTGAGWIISLRQPPNRVWVLVLLMIGALLMLALGVDPVVVIVMVVLCGATAGDTATRLYGPPQAWPPTA